MLKLIGIICAIGAVFFSIEAYYRQIRKTLRTRHSGQVSSTSYMMYLAHYSCSMTALILFSNWAGLFMEASACVACLATFLIVIHFKPKGWRLFSFGK